MPALRSSHIEVYVFRRTGRTVQLLLLRRAQGRKTLPGVWQPITGKRHVRESALAAARRELREETGFSPARWWCLERPTLYTDPVSGTLMIVPLYAAEVLATDRVALSEEHDAFAWLPLAAASRRVLWGSQRRGIEALRDILKPSPLERALAITTPPPSRRPRRG